MKQNIDKGPIAWFARNKVSANILMIFLVFGGLIVAFNIKQEVFPAFDRDSVDVVIKYPGATPEGVERGIILSVEEAVNGIDEVKEISATASEGVAKINIAALDGTDLQQFSQNIQAKIDAITTFPQETEIPRVNISTRRREVISFAIYGMQNEFILRQKAEDLRDILLENPLITQVSLDGIRELEIKVEVKQDILRKYNITLDQISNQIKKNSVDIPGGSLKTAGGEILIRLNQKLNLAKEFAKIPIIEHLDGSKVLLEDISTISEGFSEADSFATFNGMPSIMVEIYRVGDQKPLTIAKISKNIISNFQKNLPNGIYISKVRDRSEIYGQRSTLLLKNCYIGLFFVFVLLAIFLEIRLAFWVSLGIPISIIGSFWLLSFTSFSINIISMFAFIVTLGIVVDDAIIVGENIYSYRKKGLPFIDAAILGVREVSIPVVITVLTNILAFIPLFYVSGIMGKIFKIIPAVVITVFAISLIECLFILPAHLGYQKKQTKIKFLGNFFKYQEIFSDYFSKFINNYYGPVLNFVLKYRYLTVAISFSLLFIVCGYVFSGRMGMTLFPRVESDYAYVNVTLAYGTSSEKVLQTQNILIKAAQLVIKNNGNDKLSKGIFARIHENEIRIRVFLTPHGVRPISTEKFVQFWRKNTGEIPGVETIYFQSDRGGPGSGKGLTVELSNRNIETLKKVSKDLALKLSSFSQVNDIEDGSAKGKKQFNIFMLVDEQRGRINAKDTATQIRNSFYGITALKMQRGRNEIKVMVRLPKNERISEYAIENLYLKTANNNDVMLKDVATINQNRAYTQINRKSGKRINTVKANVVPRSDANKIIRVLKSEILPELMQKYPGTTYSFEGRQAEMRDSMRSLFIGLLITLAAIYAILAIPFKSYFQPIIIMISIPFGIVGAIFGHLLMGYSLSIMSLFGIVALTGVVVNDSLILIDFANKQNKSDDSPLASIYKSGLKRFRPVFLTTLTTFGGLAPMIFETSRQAKFLIPMALSLGFGILFATVITLIIVPCLYMIFYDVKNFKFYHDNVL